MSKKIQNNHNIHHKNTKIHTTNNRRVRYNILRFLPGVHHRGPLPCCQRSRLHRERQDREEREEKREGGQDNQNWGNEDWSFTSAGGRGEIVIVSSMVSKQNHLDWNTTRGIRRELQKKRKADKSFFFFLFFCFAGKREETVIVSTIVSAFIWYNVLVVQPLQQFSTRKLIVNLLHCDQKALSAFFFFLWSSPNPSFFVFQSRWFRLTPPIYIHVLQKYYMGLYF